MIIFIKIVLLLAEYIYLEQSFTTFDGKKKVDTKLCNHDFELFQLNIRPTFEKDGIVNFKCKKCNLIEIKTIPKLTKNNYIINKNAYNISELFDDKSYSFNFKKLGDVNCTGYPRLLRLSDYWNNLWLLGGNFGNVVGCRIAKDQGLTWSEPIEISKYPNYICSNIDLFELQNHEIISSFRAVGFNSNKNRYIKYNRKIGSSISFDGGYHWEKLSTIVDNYELAFQLGKSEKNSQKTCHKENRVGFFEPFVIDINNKITVFYADDFTPMFNDTLNRNRKYKYKIQNIYSQTFDLSNYKWSKERKLIMDGSLKKSPTNSGLIKRISRDGMPVLTKMKDGTYVLVFEGTYRDRNYHLLTGKYLKYQKWFEILLSYSKDGLAWSNPVEIYISKNNGTKSSAPYIVTNDKNQLIVSFQTDEDYFDFGYQGDKYSIMKVMISKPGIKIENINKDSFYDITNCNETPIGGSSIWNGLMLIGDILYTCSSDNSIKCSKLPKYDK